MHFVQLMAGLHLSALIVAKSHYCHSLVNVSGSLFLIALDRAIP